VFFSLKKREIERKKREEELKKREAARLERHQERQKREIENRKKWGLDEKKKREDGGSRFQRRWAGPEDRRHRPRYSFNFYLCIPHRSREKLL